MVKLVQPEYSGDASFDWSKDYTLSELVQFVETHPKAYVVRAAIGAAINSKWGISDKSISEAQIESGTLGARTVDEVNQNTIADTYLSVTSAAGWFGIGTIERHGRVVTFTSTDAENRGVVFDVHLDRAPKTGENLYLNFDFSSSDSAGLNGGLDVYLLAADGTIFPTKLGNWTLSADTQHGSYAISEKLYTLWKLGYDFKVLFAIHGIGNLIVSPLLNWTDQTQNIVERFDALSSPDVTSESLLISDAKVSSDGLSFDDMRQWNSTENVKFTNEPDEFVMTQIVDGNVGGYLPVRVDVTRPVYLNVELSVVGKVDLYVLSKNGDVPAPASVNGEFFSTKVPQMKRYRKVLSPQFFAALGVTGECFLLFATHVNTAVVRIRGFNFSNSDSWGSQNTTNGLLAQGTGIQPIERLGHPVLKDISSLPITAVDKIHFGTPNEAVSITNARLKSISVSVPTAGVYTFQAAKTDQYSRIVDGRSFTATLSAGYNVLDYSDQNILMPVGSHLFMDLSRLGGVYTTPTDVRLMTNTLIEDEAHQSTTTGYPGMVMRGLDGMLPYSYEVEEMPLRDWVNDLDTQAATTTESLSSVVKQGDDLYIKGGDGKKYRLVVDASGALSAVSQIPSRVAIFGNSLTKEHGDIGMAASNQYHDWYYLVTQYIKTQNPSVVINDRTNVSAWEAATSSVDRQTQFDTLIKPTLTADTGLVIYQLSDNANTDAKRATFQQDIATLIKDTKAISPKARVLVVAAWFIDPSFFAKVKQGVADGGGVLVDITPYKDDSLNSSVVGATRTGLDGTSWQITNPGEALHPSDTGMALIAQAIESKLDF